MLSEISKAKKGCFSHTKIQTGFVNMLDKQKKLVKPQTTKKLLKSVENLSPSIISKAAALLRL